MNRFESKSIEQQIKLSYSLLGKEHVKLIVGVSAGPDSMALLYLLSRAKANIFTVHINYGLRGEDSELDQELVEGMCAEWGIECCSIRLESQKEAGVNFQQWAREERYRIFRDIKEEQQADYIATAHHWDDQLETIFQKLLRGSGIGAWDGMQVLEQDVFRPLLSVSKKEIYEYCDQEAVPFREDVSNQENKYARNRLRNEVFKEFEELFPGWKQNILELEERSKSYQDAIKLIFERVFNGSGLDIESYTELPDTLKTEVIREYLLSINKDISLSKGQLIELTKIGEAQTGASFKVGNFGHLYRERGQLIFQSTHLDEVANFSLEKSDVSEGYESNGLYFHLSSKPTPNGLALDADCLSWPVMIRKWKDGDTITPLGMKGSQKISDHLTNRKVPSFQKKRSLIVQGSDKYIYAVIFPETSQRGEIGTISEKVKYNSHTCSYLIIQQVD